jgi:hypothetical protein
MDVTAEPQRALKQNPFPFSARRKRSFQRSHVSSLWTQGSGKSLKSLDPDPGGNGRRKGANKFFIA